MTKWNIMPKPHTERTKKNYFKVYVGYKKGLKSIKILLKSVVCATNDYKAK